MPHLLLSDADDTVLATMNFANSFCIALGQAATFDGRVRLEFRNNCSINSMLGEDTKPIGIMVFDK